MRNKQSSFVKAAVLDKRASDDKNRVEVECRQSL